MHKNQAILCMNPTQDKTLTGTASTLLTSTGYFFSALTSAANSTSTSTLSGVSPGGALRFVQPASRPIVPSGPPSHTYRWPPAHLRSNNTTNSCPRNGWNGWVTIRESEDSRCAPAVCAGHSDGTGSSGPGRREGGAGTDLRSRLSGLFVRIPTEA